MNVTCNTETHARTLTIFLVFATCLMASQAMALSAPGSGTFAYDLYDIGINQILLDPIVITKDNVDFLVKDGFYTKAQLGI